MKTVNKYYNFALKFLTVSEKSAKRSRGYFLAASCIYEYGAMLLSMDQYGGLVETGDPAAGMVRSWTNGWPARHGRVTEGKEFEKKGTHEGATGWMVVPQRQSDSTFV